MIILGSAILFLFSLILALSFALLVALKLLEWTLRLGLLLLQRYAEPQGGNITINIVHDDEDPPMRDVTTSRQMHRIEAR